ncbi:MAG: hypothetical protein AB1758_00525 [Candidatus Eremiobacterota bacterium]
MEVRNDVYLKPLGAPLTAQGGLSGRDLPLADPKESYDGGSEGAGKKGNPAPRSRTQEKAEVPPANGGATNAPVTVLMEEPGPTLEVQSAAPPTLQESLRQAVAQVETRPPVQNVVRPSDLARPLSQADVEQKVSLSKRIGQLFRSMLKDPVDELRAEQEQILALEAKYSEYDPNTGAFAIPDLSVKTREFRDKLASGEATLDDIRVEAYAVAREAAARVVSMRHYPVQVLGGLAMDQGKIAEMMTGEGKTLTAVLPLYLNALAVGEDGQGKGAHLVTVNETLAERDAKWMGPVFEALGLSVGVVTEGKEPDQKREGYAKEVTYTTGNAVGFDYLRDQMVQKPEQRVMRGFHYALVDEVDEILIDEARTPLILSAPSQPASDEYRLFDTLIRQLKDDGSDYKVKSKDKTVYLTDEGVDFIDSRLALQDAMVKESAARLAFETRRRLHDETARAAEKNRRAQAAYDALVGEGGAEALKAFKAALKAGDFDFLSDNARERIHKEGPRPGDLKVIGNTLRSAREIFDSTLSHTEASLEEARTALKQATADREAAEKAVEALNRARMATDQEERAVAYQEYRDAVARGSGYSIYAEENCDRVNYLENALKAHVLFRRDKDYLVDGDSVKIIDEFKGRTPEGRRYNNGLHQALEAKEGVTLQPESRVSATITYPNLFRLYKGSPELRDKDTTAMLGLAGMSGTALEAEDEFLFLYNLEVVPIDPNKRCIRDDLPDVYFGTQKEKIQALVDDVEALYRDGKPVLVGTVSVEMNEHVGSLLRARGIPCQLLNAKSVRGKTKEEIEQIERETQMISQAGRSGMVTVATNMAGRGADIKPDKLAHMKLAAEVVRRALPVGRLAAACEAMQGDGKAALLDLGEPGLAGPVAQYLQRERLPASEVDGQPNLVRVGDGPPESLKLQDFPPQPVVVDILLKKPEHDKEEAEKLKKWLDAAGVPCQIAEAAGSPPPEPGTVQIRIGPARDAGLPEGVARLNGQDFPTGGLHVRGTTRHRSRRIDRQLIGRAGRQGGPGSSKFYLSLEDDLLRYFGGDKLKPLFEKLQKEQGTAGVSHPELDALVVKAQNTLGSIDFEQRKLGTEQDETNNKQREAFFQSRRKVVDGQDMTAALQEWTASVLLDELREHLPDRMVRKWTPEEVRAAEDKAAEKLGFRLGLNPDGKLGKDDLEKLVTARSEALLKDASERLASLPGSNEADRTREALLAVLDEAWMTHLELMEGMRTVVPLVALGQQDPKVEYIRQAYDLFQGMLDGIRKEAVSGYVAEMLKRSQEIPVTVAPDAQRLVDPERTFPGFDFLDRNELRKKAKDYPARGPIAENFGEAGYRPVEFTHPEVLAGQDGAEPADLQRALLIRAVDRGLVPPSALDSGDVSLLKDVPHEDLFSSYEGVRIGEDGLPRNPAGPTGMTGRGGLPLYGANVEACPVLLRRHPETGKLQFLSRNGELPSGAVDPGDRCPDGISARLARAAVGEGAGPLEVLDWQREFERTLARNGANLYQGYVDSPLNTDHAWQEATVTLLYFQGDLARLEPGGELQWTDATPEALARLDVFETQALQRAVQVYEERTGYRVTSDGTVGRVPGSGTAEPQITLVKA